jgi:hypothetical protein
MKIVEYDRLARTACRGRSAEVDRLTDVSGLPVWHTTGIIIRTQGSLGSSLSLCGTLHQTFDTPLSCITPFTKCSCPSRAVYLPMWLQNGYKNKYSRYLYRVKWYSRAPPTTMPRPAPSQYRPSNTASSPEWTRVTTILSSPAIALSLYIDAPALPL